MFTKCSLHRDAEGEVVTDLRAASIREECEASLRRLGIERIDLYKVHWPEPDVGGSLEEAWSTLVELQREGKIRHLGGSNFDSRTSSAPRPSPRSPRCSRKYSLLAPEAERELLPAAAAPRHRRDRLLADGVGLAERLDDACARRGAARGRLAARRRAVHGAAA